MAYKRDDQVARSKSVEDLTYKKQTGGSGQYAKVQVSTRAARDDAEDGPTYEFENKVTGGRIPREFIPSVDAGAQEAMQYGILAGYPLVERQVLTLLDGGLPRRRLLRDGVQDRRFSMVFKKAAARKAQPGHPRTA